MSRSGGSVRPGRSAGVTRRPAHQRLPVGRLFEQGDHLVVTRLGEVLVELPDGEERARHFDAHHLIGGVAQLGDRLARGDRNGQHHPGGAVGPGHLARGPRCRPGSDAVVDDDGGAARHGHGWAITPKASHPALELGTLACLDRGELLGTHPGRVLNLLVDDPRPLLADGPHGQFGLEGHAQLADDDHVEGRPERSGHLEGHGHPAPGKAQHHHVRTAQVLQQHGQAPSGISTIDEGHGDLLLDSRVSQALPSRQGQ